MKKILVVDDCPDQRFITGLYLKDDFIIETAASGEEALELIKTKAFDVILTDYHMPNGDGLWLLEQLELLEFKIPVLVLSSDSRVSVLDLVKGQNRMNLTKPVLPAELVLRLQELMTRAM